MDKAGRGSIRSAATLFLATLLLLPKALAPAVIVVDDTCTLVDAITAANTDTATGGCVAGSGADEIQLTADVTLTEVADSGADGDSGLPSVTSEITVEGGGFTISRDDAAPYFRIFHVATSGTLGLNDTTVSNGYARGSSNDGGAILNRGSLTLSLSTVSHNKAGDGDDGAGGGIFNTGSLSLYYSTVDDNSARAYIGPGGGGIFTVGTALLVSSTISNNTASVEYTFGGGIYSSSVTLVNSTLSGNRASYGAAIFGSATLHNSTVAQNRALPADSDIEAALWGTFTLYNTVLDKLDYPYSYQINCAGTITDGGGNLADDDTCGPIPSTLTGVDPVLTDNGGPTLTHALLEGSSAIDTAGDCGLPFDQRGFARDDVACDSGSFEHGGRLPFALSSTICPGPSTITVSGGTPMASARLFQGPAEGSSVVPDPPCARIELLITDPTEIAAIPFDATGSGSIVIDFESPDCGQYLQAVDGDDCRKSTVEKIDSCNPLSLTHSGVGGDPTASPPASPGCSWGDHLPDEEIQLTAHPDSSWEVDGWSGTDDDASQELHNTVTMPPGAHEVAVIYVQTCFLLTLEHTGSGSDPVASPSGSADCSEGRYLEGEAVELTASPDGGWRVGGWTGTDDDSSTDTTNSLTMPATDHTVVVHYFETSCSPLSLEHSGEGSEPVASPLGDGIVWTEQPVGGDSNATSVYAADIDGDADPDVLVAAVGSDEIAWWENVSGDGTAWTEHLVDGSFDGAWSTHAEDMDGDGDLDVLGAADDGDRITWWENALGDGTAWTGHLVDGSFDGAQSVYSADVDGDGDPDVLGAAFDADDISWWENTLGDGTAWTEHLVDGSFNGATSVHGADVDGDGDPDVLGAAEHDDTIAWWENTLGDGTAWAKHLLAGGFEGASSVYAADMDGDRDLDVLGAAAFFGGEIAWWENTLGDGTAWSRHLVDGSFSGARSVQAADMDHDGDLDVVGAARVADDITWWENTAGDGTAWTEHLVDGSFREARSVHAADVDGDGDLDVLGANWMVEPFTWWENLYTGVCEPGEFRSGDRLFLTAAPAPEWAVGSWSGTDDDDSTEVTNTATMPASSHTISVHYVESTCTAPDGDTLLLEMDTVTDVEVYEVCTTITAQNDYVVMGPDGDLTLRAGHSVVFGDGFSVTEGGRLTIEIDPGLQMPGSPSTID